MKNYSAYGLYNVSELHFRLVLWTSISYSHFFLQFLKNSTCKIPKQLLHQVQFVFHLSHLKLSVEILIYKVKYTKFNSLFEAYLKHLAQLSLFHFVTFIWCIYCAGKICLSDWLIMILSSYVQNGVMPYTCVCIQYTVWNRESHCLCANCFDNACYWSGRGIALIPGKSKQCNQRWL